MRGISKGAGVHRLKGIKLMKGRRMGGGKGKKRKRVKGIRKRRG
jgi:hypothetical protein